MQLIYITNDPDRARIVQDAGVDQVMVDLEINGKVARQRGLNTIISNHAANDITVLRRILDRSDLLVRINPIFDGSKAEIEDAISRGADRIMLPMFTTAHEVSRFVEIVDGRARASLLLETPAALARLPEILQIPGIDFLHVGLNDLHLAFKLHFMFELLSGGIVDYVAGQAQKHDIRFGFGGVARLDEGRLPARLVLSDHVRLGSQQVILSRDFGTIFDPASTQQAGATAFAAEVQKLRAHLVVLAQTPKPTLDSNHLLLRLAVQEIVRDRAG